LITARFVAMMRLLAILCIVSGQSYAQDYSKFDVSVVPEIG